MSIRHYISVDEPLEKLTHQKIKTYILKPLMFSLRLERYCKTGVFPLSINELLYSYNDEYRYFIEYFINKEKFDKDIYRDHKDVFHNLHEFACELLN